MLKSLFKKTPPWESKDADLRTRAVARANSPMLLARLPQLAQEDPVAAVRSAAVQRLDDLRLVRRIADQDTADSVRKAAHRRFRELLSGEAPAGPSLEERLEVVPRIEDDDLIEYLAQHGQEPPLRLAAVQQISRQGLLGDYAISHADPKVRLHAVGRIEQQSTLARVAEATRTSDKKVHQAASDRLAARRQTEGGSPALAAEQAQSMVDEMEAMARGERIGNRQARLAKLREQWNTLPDLDDASLARRFTGAARLVEAALNAPDMTAEQRREAAAEKTAEAPDTRIKEPAPKTEAAPDQPGTAETVSDKKADQAEKKVQRERQIEQLRETLDQLDQHLEAGHFADSREALQQAHQQMDQLGGMKALSQAGLAGRLRRARGQIHELRRWQRWANDKRRKELIAKVESIIPGDLHPDALANLVKDAQAQWKALEESERLSSDKGHYHPSPDLWKHFRKVCNTAWKPAGEFFKARSEVRDERREDYTAVLEEMDQWAQADSPDWRKGQQLSHQARKLLRGLNQLAPHQRGKMASRIKQRLDQVHGRLDEHYQTTEQARRRLILEAQKTAQRRDNERAEEEAKALQQQWKDTGLLPRARDRKLWNEFRGHLDPIFEQRDARVDEARAQDAEQRGRLQAILDEMTQLLDQERLPDSAMSMVEQARSRWRDVDFTDRYLEGRFDQATTEVSQRLQQQQVQARAQRRAALYSALCEVEDAEINQKKLAPVDLETPGELGDELRARAETADQATPVAQESLEQAQELAIALELLAGIDSPEEARQARLASQVEQLSASLGGRKEENEEAPEQRLEGILRSWVGLGPLGSGQTAQKLRERFHRAWQAATEG